MRSDGHAPGAPPSDLTTADALAAVWCRSVGTSWTLELHELAQDGTLNTIRDWITSGVPISQPEPPEALARELLTQRELELFRDPSVGPGTHNRRGIGYAHRKIARDCKINGIIPEMEEAPMAADVSTEPEDGVDETLVR